MIRRNVQKSLIVGIMTLMTACTNPGGSGAGAPGSSDAMAASSSPVMLGVRMGPPGTQLAKMLGVDPSTTTIINHVADDTPAKRGGLHQWDVVIAVDGEQDASPEAIRRVLKQSAPGETVDFEVVRGGERRKIKIVLEPADPARLNRAGTANGRR